MSLDGSAETWPSGRRRSPAKGVDGKPSRGFESHRLRHLPLFGGIKSGLLFWWGRLDVAAALVQQRDGWVDLVIFAQPVGEGGGGPCGFCVGAKQHIKHVAKILDREGHRIDFRNVLVRFEQQVKAIICRDEVDCMAQPRLLIIGKFHGRHAWGGSPFLSGHLLFKLVQGCAMRRRTAEALCGGDLCDLIGGDSHKIIAQSARQPKRKGHALRIHAIEAHAIFDGHIFCGKGFDLAQGGLFVAIFRLHSSAFVTQAWQGPQSYRTPVSRITAFA